MLRIPFRLLGNLFRIIAYLWSKFWFALAKRFRRRTEVYVELELETTYPLGASRSGVRKWFVKTPPSLLDVREMIKRAARQPEVRGILLRSKGLGMGPARIADLAEIVSLFKTEGKRVVIQTDSATLRDFQLLSLADDLLLTPAGRLYLFGLRFDELFAEEILERLGVMGQFIHIGAFKTATHRFHKRGMTTPQRLMMEALHQGYTDLFVGRIAAQRGVSPQQVSEAMHLSPLTATQALQMGLIDGTTFWEDALQWPFAHRVSEIARTSTVQNWRLLDAPRSLGAPLPDDEIAKKSEAQLEELKAHESWPDQISTYPLESYTDSIPALRLKPLRRTRPYIGVLDLSGAIVMETQGPSPLGATSDAIRASETCETLKRMRQDSRCIGLLIHINSPGGSALASDIIWRQIDLTRQVKPVVSYCSDVCASGGYYLASGTDKIVCRADSIIGSIGVITGKISFGETLKKIDLHVESIFDHPSALFSSPYHALPEEVMEVLKLDARAFYRRFLERVGQARSIERARLHRFGRGRVYLGEDALRRGLVDVLGGLEDAIDGIYSLCETTPLKTTLTYVDHRKQNLRDVISGSILGAAVPASSSVSRLLHSAHTGAAAAAWLEREGLLALMPFRPDFSGPSN